MPDEIDITTQHRREIRELLELYPGILPSEIASRLAINLRTVSRHVSAIRAGWGGKPISTTKAGSVQVQP